MPAVARPRPGQEKINADLRPLLRQITKLKADPENARVHNDRNIEAIKFSLERFGQQKPVVTLRDGTVIAGNGLLEAAKQLRWRNLAVVVLPADSVDEARAYALADNRTAELSEWDFQKVAAELRSLKEHDFPVPDLGWAEYELEALMNATFEPGAAGDGDGSEHGGVAPVRLTAEQREVFERACEKLRGEASDAGIPEGRCLELIAAEFLS
jgi:ParB-like chromosome segregation protein Spo0J